MLFLDEIRTAKKLVSLKKRIYITIGILLFGILMGTFSKYLDYRHAELPQLFQIIDYTLDFHNFLGGFAPWIVIAVCISIYSYTPFRATINVFSFFVGMVASYYVYSNFVAGFFPKSYAMIWIGFTIVSPILAYICWYAKGKGVIALILSACVISVLINTAFAYGIFYISISSWLNVLMLILGIVILYKSPKETILMICIGIILAILVETFIPFHIW